MSADAQAARTKFVDHEIGYRRRDPMPIAGPRDANSMRYRNKKSFEKSISAWASHATLS